jgi:hypothetical protein
MKAWHSTMSKHLAILGPLLGVGWARAHEGHGLPGLSHWHADDVAGLLALVVAAGLGLWLVRRK